MDIWVCHLEYWFNSIEYFIHVVSDYNFSQILLWIQREGGWRWIYVHEFMYEFMHQGAHLNDTKYLEIFYKVLVQSQISYGMIGWGGTY